MSHYAIVLFQEAHGGQADMHALRTALPRHRLYGSFGPSLGAGGLLFALGPACTLEVEMIVVVPGRIAFIRMTAGTQEYVLINVHLCPGLGRATATTQLRRLRSRLQRHAAALHIFIGDFNFVDPAEGRLHLPSGTLSPCHDVYHEVWHDIFPSLCEIVQPAHTRRKMQDGRVSILSRLDKVFTNLPDTDLHLASASCGVLWSASFDQKGSDHVAIRLSLCQGSRPPLNPFPRWIITHPLFRLALRERVDAAELDNDCEFTRQDFKDLALEIARGARRTLSRSSASTPLEKLHWAVLALRGALCGNWDLVDLARPRWPPLSVAFARFGCTEAFVSALRSMVRTLSQTGLDREISDIEEEIADHTRCLNFAQAEAARLQLARARARRERWSIQQRRLVLTSVLQESGAAAEDDYQAADLLHRHWSAIAAASQVDESRFQKFKPYVQKIPSVDWAISFDDFLELLDSRRDSAPGPDCLPIGVWRDAGPSVAKLLYRTYLSILASGCCPPDFCTSISVFIPKGTDDDGTGEAAAAPEDLRPICLSNADTKVIIAALTAPLGEASRFTLHPAQACAKGRKMVDNIWDLELHRVNSFLYRRSGTVS